MLECTTGFAWNRYNLIESAGGPYRPSILIMHLYRDNVMTQL